MATVLNKRDVALQAASPRTVTVNLGSTVNVNGTVSGNVTGTLNGTSVTTVVNAALNATANYFTTSTSDPTGGANGDAHFNSSTNVMWFKVSGTWTRGGTVSASEITTGTLAAARIAANSITASKINVSSLSSVSANLGTVTAGDITGTSNINITGQARFGGATTEGGATYAGVFNSSGGSTHGVGGWATTGLGIWGNATSGSGVFGSASTGTGVKAQTTGGGTALQVIGPMTITSSALVSNLNADAVDGVHASALAKLSGGNTFSGDQTFSNNVTVSGLVRGGDFSTDKAAVTGTATATFPGNNKPGSTTTVKFVPFTVNGTFGHLAWWPNV